MGPRYDPADWLTVAELALVQVAALVLLGLTTPVARLLDGHADMILYHELASSAVGGAIPYVDLPIEYPPLALVSIIGPHLLPSPTDVDLQSYAWRFLGMNVVFATAIALLFVSVSRSRAVSRDPAGMLTAYLPFAVVLSPLVAWRFDVLPALLSLGAYALILRHHPVAAGFALAGSILAKLYALPLVAIFAAWQIASRNHREAAVFVSTVAIVCIAALGVYAWPGITPSFLWFQVGRGIQVESLPGGIIGLASLGGLEAGVEYSFGAYQVTSPWNGPAVVITQVAAPVLVGGVLVLAVLRFRERDRSTTAGGAELAAYATAILLAVIVTNKALSPQYLVWLLPFVPLVPAGPRLLLLGAAFLTAVIFPFLYNSLLRADSVALAVLNVRNAALVIALVWLVLWFRPTIVRTRRYSSWWHRLTRDNAYGRPVTIGGDDGFTGGPCRGVGPPPTNRRPRAARVLPAPRR